MNFDGRTSSFDSQGFIFTVKCGLVVIACFATLHLGYSFVFSPSLDEGLADNSAIIEKKSATYQDYTHLSVLDVVGDMSYSLLSNAGSMVRDFFENFSTERNVEQSNHFSYDFTVNSVDQVDAVDMKESENTLVEDGQKIVDEQEIKKQKEAEKEAEAELEKNNPALVLKKVKAISYLVGDLDSGQVILEHNSGMVRPMASISKLMTAIIALDRLNPYQKITLEQSVIDTLGDAGGFVAGEILTVDQLVHSMIMESSNDAAVALSKFYDDNKTESSTFAELMNQKAKDLGMVNTHYDEATGLSDGNYTTANDLFTLAWRMSMDHEGIYKISRIDKFDISTTTEHHFHLMKNINPFVKDINFLGGKTGRTDTAKETMLTIFKVPNYAGSKSSKKIVIIVLGTDNRIRDTSLLRHWASLKR